MAVLQRQLSYGARAPWLWNLGFWPSPIARWPGLNRPGHGDEAELRGFGLPDRSPSVALCMTNPNTTEPAFRRVQMVLDSAGAPLADS